MNVLFHATCTSMDLVSLLELSDKLHHGLFILCTQLHGADSLVYRRGDGTVRVLSGEAAILEGLQERRGCDGDCSILRDSIQRPLDHELLQRQVKRISRFPSCHQARPHL